MHHHKRKIKVFNSKWPFARQMQHYANKSRRIHKPVSIFKLAELYLNYKAKKIRNRILDAKTHLISSAHLKSSVFKYRWRNHDRAREYVRNGIFKHIFITNS